MSLLLIAHFLVRMPSSSFCLSPLSTFRMYMLSGQLSGPIFRMDTLTVLLFSNYVGSLSFSYARLLWLWSFVLAVASSVIFLPHLGNILT